MQDVLTNIPMKHYILTRFSLIYPSWKESAALVNEERRRWFGYRAQMFHETLLKSVISQTVGVEKIILLMDSGDLDLYNTYLRNDESIIQPIFTGLNDVDSNVNAFLMPKRHRRISVSRVDSDDMLACNYIERKYTLYEQAKRNNNCIYVVADHGYRSNLHYIQSIADSTSPFITVFYEHYTGLLDLGGNHREIFKREPIYCHDANWLQIIHDSNVGNIFDESIIEKISTSNWPHNIHRLDSRLIGGYVLNNEVSRSVKRRLYAIMLRTHTGVWVVRYLKRFLKYFSKYT